MNTTNLEQSQKLKELGAPLTARFMWWKLSSEVKGSKEPYVATFSEALPGSVEVCAAYTLSELIEWLGDKLIDLRRASEGNWRASGWSDDYTKEMDNYYDGATPLEAVYNLAVAIKENK